MVDGRIGVDYLVIGAGAVAMAFADTLLAESDFTVAMVDRRHRPGGHWNDAYPFVRLHGPSANYGVNSRHLGSDRIDASGLNRGLYELASGSEICTYFDEVMRQELLPTGRMRYLPMHRYDGDGRAISLLTGATTEIEIGRKVVDATFADTQIPARSAPGFDVADGARVVPPNDLVWRDQAAERYVVIGAGKTAIDTVTWMLQNGVDPDRVTWVRPRDAWLLNRKVVQPTFAFFEHTYGWLTANVEAAAAADTAEEIFLHLEREGCMFRIDPDVVPTMYRCAIVSEHEREQLRRVTDVVRMGHVTGVAPGRIVLEGGARDVPEGTLFVNCSADGIPRKPPEPVYQPGRIVPQYVRTCSPTFSGALIAKVELLFGSDDEKNAVTRPTPIPDTPADWIPDQLFQLANGAAWQRNDALRDWLLKSRLDQFSMMVARAVSEGDPAKVAVLERYRRGIRPAVERLTAMTEGAAG